MRPAVTLPKRHPLGVLAALQMRDRDATG